MVARPYEGDARYLSNAPPVIELIKSKSLPADGDILSPPTIDQPRDHLRPHPGCHHVLRFDGHGSYGDSAGGHSLHQYKGRQGSLIFENEKGGADPKSARDLSALRREHAMPAVVLNACPAGMLDKSAGDAFSSVATVLLQSGMSSVVAVTDVNGDGRPDILGHSPKIG